MPPIGARGSVIREPPSEFRTASLNEVLHTGTTVDGSAESLVRASSGFSSAS